MSFLTEWLAMSRIKGSIRSRLISRSSLVVRVESLETRVPVSEGMGPFLTMSALATLGELARSSALPPPCQAVHFDNLTSTQSHPDSIHVPLGPKPISSLPAADLPLIAQPVADVPVTSFAADEADLFQALPGAPFAADLPLRQARPSWDGQEPVAFGPGSSAPVERAPAPTRSNAADHVAPNDRADAELFQAVAALRAGSPGDQGPGTTGIENIPVDLTYKPVFPMAARALAGQPFTYEFTAEVDVNVLPITPCELGQPTWQWGVGAGYSSSPAGPYLDPPYGSWSHSMSSPNSSATAVTFTTQVEGHWEFVVGVTVEYQDSCANIWGGGGNVTLVESTFAAAPPFKMESKPNSLVAIRNEYVEQIGTAEVLKDWNVRYTAPLGGATRWQSRRAGETTWIWITQNQIPVEANPLEWTEDRVGDWDIRFARGAAFNEFSAARRIKVIEPQLVNFTLAVPDQGRGQYTKQAYHVLVPNSYAVGFQGAVDSTAASPSSLKILWGFVQSVEKLMNVTLNWDVIMWTPQTPNGTTVAFPTRLSAQSTPTRVNDAPLGKQLYDGHSPYTLSQQLESTNDTPSAPNSAEQTFKDSLNQATLVKYDRNQHSGQSYAFVTWIVVYNRETQQYMPLRQIPWTLQIDTTQTGPWVANVGPGASPTKPVEATESVAKYNTPVLGPLTNPAIAAPRTRP